MFSGKEMVKVWILWQRCELLGNELPYAGIGRVDILDMVKNSSESIG